MNKQHNPNATVTIPLSEYLYLSSMEDNPQLETADEIAIFLQEQKDEVVKYLKDKYGDLYAFFTEEFVGNVRIPINKWSADFFVRDVFLEGIYAQMKADRLNEHQCALEQHANGIKEALRLIHDGITELRKAPFYKKDKYRRKLRQSIQGFEMTKLKFNREALNIDTRDIYERALHEAEQYINGIKYKAKNKKS